MIRLLNQTCIAFLLMAMISSWAYAQEEENSEDKTDEQEEAGSSDKAQEAANNLANPNATIGFLTFPTDLTWYQGDLPDAGSQTGFRFNFQPSLTIKIGEDMNLFVRPLIPVIIKIK